MSHLETLSIEFDTVAKQRVARVAARLGMTELNLQSRLMQWFAMAPAQWQASIVGRDGVDVGRAILYRMAQGNQDGQ